MRAREEAVIAARARARQTADDEVRYRNLVAARAVSASEYDQARAAAESARAELNAAEAQAGVARNESSYAILFADADGVVIETLAEPGQVVAAGQAVVRVAHAGTREGNHRASRNAAPADRVHRSRDLVWKRTDGLLRNSVSYRTPQTVRLERSKLDTYWRVVWQMPRWARRSPSRSLPFRSRDGHLRSPVQVPIGAIFDPGNGPGVWLVEGETPRVTWRAVQLAGLSDEAASVVGNLKAGDQVVALGAHLLHEGEQVRSPAKRGHRRSVAVNRVARQ